MEQNIHGDSGYGQRYLSEVCLCFYQQTQLLGEVVLRWRFFRFTRSIFIAEEILSTSDE